MMDENELKKFIENLEKSPKADNGENSRNCAAWMIRNEISSKNPNAVLAILPLAKALFDPYVWVVSNSSEALYYAAQNGWDISFAVPNLIKTIPLYLHVDYVCIDPEDAPAPKHYAKLALIKFATNKKENALLVLIEIDISKVDKSIPEIKEILIECKKLVEDKR